jgi:hypothetical protein
MLSDYQVVIFDVTDLFLLLHFLQGQNSLLYAKLVLQTWRFCWKWSTSCTQTLSWRTHSMRWRCLSDVSCLISTYLKRSRKTVSLFWVGELYKCITLSCVVFCLFLILPSVWICSKRNLFSSGYLWIIYINSRVYCFVCTHRYHVLKYRGRIQKTCIRGPCACVNMFCLSLHFQVCCGRWHQSWKTRNRSIFADKPETDFCNMQDIESSTAALKNLQGTVLRFCLFSSN